MMRKRLHAASNWMDLVVNLFKWPAAIAAIVFLPGVAAACVRLLGRIAANPGHILPVLGGAAMYLVAWWAWLRRPGFTTFGSTIEHELTHALFALLTLHPVVAFRATWKSGGHMAYRGGGNWLITISPYFFPTVCVLLLAVSWLTPAAYRSWLDGLMGAALVYHVTSTMVETHIGQTDLKKVGWPFSILFLPTANLAAYGLILGFCHAGRDGLVEFAKSAAWIPFVWS